MVSIKPLIIGQKLLNRTSNKITKQSINFHTEFCEKNFCKINSAHPIEHLNYLSTKRIKNIINIFKERFITKFIRKPYNNIEVSPQVKALCENIDIKKIATENNLLGKGANGRVYRIPDSAYAIKIPTNYTPNNQTKITDLCRTLRDKVNFIEARFGQTQILKYIEGVPVRNASFNTTNMNKEIASKMSKSLNNLSDSNIKKYYLQILEGKRLGLGHDFIGNNCLLNLSKNNITAIDFDIGRKTYILESFIFQCGEPKLLNKVEQNSLFKKGLRNLLELIQEGKILSNEVNLSGQTLSENAKICCFEIKDMNYFNYLCQLCDDFSKNKSFENINNILCKL